MRLVITIPDLPADATEAALAVLRLDATAMLPAIAESLEEVGQAGELKPGQYGFSTDPDTHAVTLHWAIKDDQGRGYVPPAEDQGATS